MPKVFAQHADAGEHHLEIRYVAESPKPWEWFVLLTKTKTTVFSGESDTLEGAKKSAASRVGLYEAEWRNIGPAIELPD